jgi:hypothetical protein
VHRLLKSQSKQQHPVGNDTDDTNSREFTAEQEQGQHIVSIGNEHHQVNNGDAPSLTKELLQKHDQRWEEECRDNWRRRLSANSGVKSIHGLKRRSNDDDEKHKASYWLMKGIMFSLFTVDEKTIPSWK